jgi:hypothetical protein
MREFNQYKLFDTVTGKLVVPSTKPGFCLADGEQVLPNAGPAKFSITCRANDVMGISAGWADVYAADRECQYLVIDGIPNGNYTLVAITNTAHAVAEDSFDDNAVSRGLLIEGDTVVEFMTTTPPSHFLNPSDSLSATSSTLSNTTTSVQGSTTSASPTSATISTTTPSILPTTTTSVQESHTAVAAVVSTTSTVASSSSVGAVPSQSASAASQGSFVQEFIATLAVLALTFVVL